MSQGDVGHDPKPEVPGPAARKRRWLWALVVTIAACAAALVVLVAASGSRASRAIAEAKKEAKAKGYVTSLEEFFARQGQVADESNAARVYEKAFEALTAGGGPNPDIPGDPDSRYVPIVSRALTERNTQDLKLQQAQKDVRLMEDDPRTPIPEYILAAMKTYVAHRKEVVELVGAARELPKARYRVLYAVMSGDADQGRTPVENTPLPHLTPLRSIARLMAVAAWVDAEEDRAADAIVKVRDSLATARSLGCEPHLISPLVEMASASITVRQALPRILGRTNPSNTDLQGLQKDVELFARELSLRRAIEGELAMAFERYNEIESGRVTLREVFRPSDYLGVGDAAAEQWVNRVLPGVLVGYYKFDIVMSAEYLMWVLKNMDANPLTLGTLPDPLLTKVNSRRYYLAAGMAGAIPRAFIQAEKSRSMLRATAAALAACRYRNDHGNWPESLDALVPAYLDSVPLDPFTGKPLMYKIEEAGVALYSVGENGIDDGGEGYLPGSNAAKGDDNGMRVWK